MSKITRETAEFPEKLGEALSDIATDLANLKASFDVAIAKLNADGGVTDTDYATSSALNTSND